MFRITLTATLFTSVFAISAARADSTCQPCYTVVAIENEEVYGKFAYISNGEVKEVYSTDRMTEVTLALGI